MNAYAAMAQAVERILGKDEVGGSIPPSSSRKKDDSSESSFFQRNKSLSGFVKYAMRVKYCSAM